LLWENSPILLKFKRENSERTYEKLSKKSLSLFTYKELSENLGMSKMDDEYQILIPGEIFDKYGWYQFQGELKLELTLNPKGSTEAEHLKLVLESDDYVTTSIQSVSLPHGKVFLTFEQNKA